MIVVSEIGEMWSPHTAPAKTADTEITIMFWSVEANMSITIGTRIANVPHDVPVEKPRKIAIANMITGMKMLALALLPTVVLTKSLIASWSPMQESMQKQGL